MIYFYRVVQRGKIENVSLAWGDQEWGWLSLGEFECENGEITVELSDKVGGSKCKMEMSGWLLLMQSDGKN